jgi:hypothetical protein
MAFDPDEYLRKNSAPEKPQSGFDPDAYLAKHEPQVFNPTGVITDAAKSFGNAALGAMNVAGRAVDRFTGAPMRAAIGAAQNANSVSDIVPNAVSAGFKQFGSDPELAPTGEDIVKKAGVPEGIPSKVAGIGMDLAANPMNFIPADAIASGASKLAPMISKGVAKGSEIMTGVPSEAVERLIARPGQVLSAEDPGKALNVAKSARAELLARDAEEDAAIRAARSKFKNEFGDRQPDTTSVTNNMADFAQRNESSPQGFGPVPDAELNQISEMSKKLGDMNAGDLQKFSDYIDTRIKNFDQSKMPGSGDTRFQSYLRSLRGQIKGKLHELDPEGLGAADKQFHNYATNADRLGKLEDENQMESFINNYFGKNKTLMRESAEDLIPDSVKDIADIGASRAFTKQGPAGSEMGARRIVGSGIGGILGAHGVMTHNPLEIAAGAAAHAMTSPEVHKQVIGRSAQAIGAIKNMPWFQAIQKNPALLDTIGSPELKKIINGMIQPGHEIPIPSYAGGPAADREPADHHPKPEDYQSPDDAKQKYLEGN